MAKVKATTYLSPTLVLIAMDWDEGLDRHDFLGFAIKRTPGFRGKTGKPQAESDWLPNRIGFNGANPKGTDMPSNTNPIQHFQWWDARIDTEDRGKNFTYEIFPVVGPWQTPQLLEEQKETIACLIPKVEENGIGTYFNRAVVSSQAFSREFGNIKTHAQYEQALAWLSNGMNDALTTFIAVAKGKGLAGAAYHLTDNEWTIPALQDYKDPASFVYFFKSPSASGKQKGDSANLPTLKTLKPNKNITFDIRTKTSIMHDKFIVRVMNDNPDEAEAVLMGTANFTTEGLTQQANVIHTFESPELASFYMKRQMLLRTDPTIGKTAAGATWSKLITVGDATVRVFFPPEQPAANKKNNALGSRVSIDTVVHAVQNAKSSVFFSLFSVTDKQLLDACKSVADNGKLMRGLVNVVREPKADAKEDATTVAATWLFERSQDDNMVVGHDDFRKGNLPNGFWWESNTLTDPDKKSAKKSADGKKNNSVPTVFVHQKIVIIDGETETPTIFVGSANLSGNSTWNNDENLLEITNCARLSRIYIAEFLRLYEQYRARFSWNKRHPDGNTNNDTFSLTKDTSWAAKDYKAGTMEYNARLAFVGTTLKNTCFMSV